MCDWHRSVREHLSLPGLKANRERDIVAEVAQLYQVSALDPVTFLVTPILVLAVAMAAKLFPARRATRVDPVRALTDSRP